MSVVVLIIGRFLHRKVDEVRVLVNGNLLQALKRVENLEKHLGLDPGQDAGPIPGAVRGTE